MYYGLSAKILSLKWQSTYVVDIRSNLRMQASADTPPVEHAPNPPIFVECTFLPYLVLVQYPFPERHYILFGAVLEKG